MSSLTRVLLFGFILSRKGGAALRGHLKVSCEVTSSVLSYVLIATPTLTALLGNVAGSKAPTRGHAEFLVGGAVSASPGYIYLCLFGITLYQRGTLFVHSHECKNGRVSSAIRLQTQ